MGFGRSEPDRIIDRLPTEIAAATDLLVVPCERRQGFVLADDWIAWVGVRTDGRRDRHADTWSVSMCDVTRVLWNRIGILDRQEVTVRLADDREITVAPLEPSAWSSIRPHLEDSGRLPAPSTIGERLGGFLPADPRAGRSAIVYVDSDLFTWRGRQVPLDGSTSARFGYRPGGSRASGFLRGYALQDMFTRRSPHGMEAYVRIEGDGWQIDSAIAAKDPAYAMALVERINDLAQRRRAVPDE